MVAGKSNKPLYSGYHRNCGFHATMCHRGQSQHGAYAPEKLFPPQLFSNKKTILLKYTDHLQCTSIIHWNQSCLHLRSIWASQMVSRHALTTHSIWNGFSVQCLQFLRGFFPASLVPSYKVAAFEKSPAQDIYQWQGSKPHLVKALIKDKGLFITTSTTHKGNKSHTELVMSVGAQEMFTFMTNTHGACLSCFVSTLSSCMEMQCQMRCSRLDECLASW